MTAQTVEYESLTEITEALDAKRRELHQIFTEAGPDLDMTKVKCITGTTDQKAAEIDRRNNELSALGQKKDRLELAKERLEGNRRQLEIQGQPVNGPLHEPGGGFKDYDKPFTRGDLRRAIEGSKGYQEFRRGDRSTAQIEIPGIDLKTLVTLTTINRPAVRQPDVVDMALESRAVSDLMLQGSTDGNTIEYYEETTFTNAAVEVAEAASKPESAVGYTLRTESVRKIAHWIPATKEALDDVSFLESQLRGRLAFGVIRREETQLLVGDGTAPNISGITDRAGIQTQAKGADPTPDAVYKAMQLVRGAAGLGFAEPTGVIFHPNDWTAIKLQRTADGIYIWGNPSDEGPDRIWGLPVRQTTGMTENTALVGAFRPHAEVIRREGITITVSTEHASYFIENKVAMLAESRLALAVYRPSAFATVTGI